MKESVGYTVLLNIAIVYIVIVFAFLSSVVIYYKSNKVSNAIMYSVEKYEGYNKYAKEEISRTLETLGYGSQTINCGEKYNDNNTTCDNVDGDISRVKGYCIYYCKKDIDSEYYYYKVKTNMMINIPIINDLMNIPIYSNTEYIYDFESKLQ